MDPLRLADFRLGRPDVPALRTDNTAPEDCGDVFAVDEFVAQRGVAALFPDGSDRVARAEREAGPRRMRCRVRPGSCYDGRAGSGTRAGVGKRRPPYGGVAAIGIRSARISAPRA